MTRQIDYYGTKYNYIHLKFGNAWKMYNFTENFKKNNTYFVEQYVKYWNQDTSGIFSSASDVIEYIRDNNVPVHLYFNYTDEPATIEEALEWCSENKPFSFKSPDTN